MVFLSGCLCGGTIVGLGAVTLLAWLSSERLDKPDTQTKPINRLLLQVRFDCSKAGRMVSKDVSDT